jgi:hypothetical protein
MACPQYHWSCLSLHYDEMDVVFHNSYITIAYTYKIERLDNQII